MVGQSGQPAGCQVVLHDAGLVDGVRPFGVLVAYPEVGASRAHIVECRTVGGHFHFVGDELETAGHRAVSVDASDGVETAHPQLVVAWVVAAVRDFQGRLLFDYDGLHEPSVSEVHLVECVGVVAGVEVAAVEGQVEQTVVDFLYGELFDELSVEIVLVEPAHDVRRGGVEIFPIESHGGLQVARSVECLLYRPSAVGLSAAGFGLGLQRPVQRTVPVVADAQGLLAPSFHGQVGVEGGGREGQHRPCHVGFERGAFVRQFPFTFIKVVSRLVDAYGVGPFLETVEVHDAVAVGCHVCCRAVVGLQVYGALGHGCALRGHAELGRCAVRVPDFHIVHVPVVQVGGIGSVCTEADAEQFSVEVVLQAEFFLPPGVGAFGVVERGDGLPSAVFAGNVDRKVVAVYGVVVKQAQVETQVGVVRVGRM